MDLTWEEQLDLMLEGWGYRDSAANAELLTKFLASWQEKAASSERGPRVVSGGVGLDCLSMLSDLCSGLFNFLDFLPLAGPEDVEQPEHPEQPATSS